MKEIFFLQKTKAEARREMNKQIALLEKKGKKIIKSEFSFSLEQGSWLIGIRYQ